MYVSFQKMTITRASKPLTKALSHESQCVAGNGASCHVGYQSCFYRKVLVGKQSNASAQYAHNTLIFTFAALLA
ncbi:MAG: hypothetical protein ACI8PW_000677 [Methylophilaceae bacterium]|jgi:hypothetical protein